MIDHDQLFKKLLKEFFREFVELFLPAVFAYLDPGEIEFLDKEVFTKLQPGKKHSGDLVAKVKFKGRAAHFLVHCEPESSRRRKRGEFGRRLFDYFALFTREYKLPVYPVAILSYDKPRDAEDDVFRVEFPDKTVLEFRFTIIQLNRLNWRDFLQHDNPVAAALMTKMGFAPEERVAVKMECLRMIVRLRYDRKKTQFLVTFVDTYLDLNAEEAAKFAAAVEELPHEEQEETMEIMTSWERRGLQQGLQRERELVLRMLASRVGELNERMQESLAQLPIEQVENLALALLNFKEPGDLTRWLQEQAAANGKTNGKTKSKTNGQKVKK